MDFKTIKESIQKEYTDLDLGLVDVYFHNSTSSGLHQDNFNHKYDPKGSKETGMFVHMGDDWFQQYGGKTYAVVVMDREVLVTSRPVDSMHATLSDKKEIFLSKSLVEEIVEL